MDNSLILILMLLFCACGNNGNNGCPSGRSALDGYEPVTGGCYDDCDLRNMTTPYHQAKEDICNLETLLVIMMFFLFKEINAPIAAIPVFPRNERQNPVNENSDNNRRENNNCCNNG